MINFLTMVMVRISLGVVMEVAVVLVILFEVVWRWVLITMVQHVLLLGAVWLKERQAFILVFVLMHTECLQRGVLVVNELGLAVVGRVALDTTMLVSPKELLVAGQRGHVMHMIFLSNALMAQFSHLVDYLDAMTIMFNLMMWNVLIFDETSFKITVAMLVWRLIVVAHIG